MDRVEPPTRAIGRGHATGKASVNVADVGVAIEATAQGACNAAKGEPEDVE